MALKSITVKISSDARLQNNHCKRGSSSLESSTKKGLNIKGIMLLLFLKREE